MKRLIIAAAMAVASLMAVGPAMATCFTASILDGPFKGPPQCFEDKSIAPNGAGGAPILGLVPVPPTDPVVVPPTDPTDPVIDPPVDPTDPVIDPPTDPTDPVIDPPTDPVDPPTDPVDPPTDPVDPPTDPVDPPSEPVGTIHGNVSDTPFAGTPAGTYYNVEYNGVTYGYAVVGEDGSYSAYLNAPA